ncbi:MAG: bacillithiol biosynthesis cysteine-adding enzyme BshC [bacterium]|jgi:bacillithiol biosynthesis cysteine-adding enzyme BshC
MHVPFSRLGGYKRLFIDYAEDFAKVSGFYRMNPRDPSSFSARLSYLDGKQFARAQVADVLAEQNRGWGAADAAIANIDALRDPKTSAVVAGQQAGLFGGPMYTLLKAACAVRWARGIEAANPGRRVVPVFWIASDDHDWNEVKRFHWIGADNALHHCEYSPETDISGRPVGAVEIDARIAGAFECFFGTNPETEYTSGLRRELEGAYRAGATMADAFAKLISAWMSDYGLVVCDPMDARLKAIGAPVFARAIEARDAIFAGVAERNAELEKAGYHAQIGLPPDGTNLFVIVNGKREALRTAREGYVTESGAEFGAAELAKLITDEPERISPNVVVRPVYQDTLFPVAASVVGPSELSYYAQITGAYGEFGLEPPVYLPRHSLTVIEQKTQKILGEIGCEWWELGGDPDEAIKRIVRSKLPQDLDEAFNRYRVSTILAGVELERKVVEFEPTMEKPMQKMAASLHHYADDIEKKVRQAYKQKNQVWVERVGRAAASLFPERGFQERFAGPVYFLNKYGGGVIERVVAEMNPAELGHHWFAV